MIQGFVRDQQKKKTCAPEKDGEEQITRKLKQRKKWVFHFESFLNLLLGFKMKGEEKNLFKQIWGIQSSQTYLDQLPSGVIKFNNPDHYDSTVIIPPLEVFDIITQTFSFDNLNPKHKILLKAIESVYLQLRPAAIDIYTLQNQLTKGFHQFMNTQMQSNLASEADIIEEDTDYQLSNFKEKLILSLNNKLLSKKALKLSNQTLFLEVFAQDYQSIVEQGPKSLTGGNHLKQVNNQQERTNLPTKDLLTLMRYIILIFLFMNGFQVKQHISKDGKFIYFYLYLSEKNLEILAEKHKLKKKLNLYFIDLFSLEPVDSNFRPLRLNNRLWKPNQYELSDMFKYLMPQIKRLIEEINYKRIAREVNQNKINPKILQQGEHDIQNDTENLSDFEWMAYYQYLVYLNEEITVLRRHYQMESDIAALINGQISPLNLYVARNKSLKKTEIDLIKQDRYHTSKISLLEQQMMNLMNEYENVLDKNQVPNSKLIKITKQEKLAFTYYELFRQALKIANNDQKLLFTFWDRMRLNNVNPKYPYVGINKYQLYTHKAKQMMCWCKYQINELRSISLFSPIERIKLANLGLYDIMNIDKLEINGFIQSSFCLNDNYELFGICEISDEVLSNTKGFFQQQTQNLSQQLRINYLKPWIIHKELLIEYYGEKIGLYFSFLGHLIKYVVVMSLVQLSIYILSLIAEGYYHDSQTELSNIFSIINSIIQTVWITVFDLVWQREIKIIQINQGNNIKENQTSRKRNAFKGEIKRSVEVDYMNSQVQNVQLNAIKQCLTYFLISLFMLFYSGIVIGLIFLGEKIKQDENLILFPKFEVIITSILNYLLIFPSEQLFYQFSLSMVQFINPLYVKDFENYLVVKYFALNFIAHIGPFVFLNSFSYLLNLYCKETYCLIETRYTFYSFIVLIGIKYLFKFLLLNKRLLKVSTVNYSLLNRNIEDFVENEGQKIRFDVSLEENGLIKEYIELFITNTFIFTFGQLSGFSWFILLFLMMIRLQTLKLKLFHFYQRPWPKYESDIGIFQSLLLFINQFTIIISSSIESFQYSVLTKDDVLLFFVIVMLGNFIVQFIVMHILREPPDKYKILQARQHYLAKSTIEQFQGKSKHQNGQLQNSKEEDLKKYPIYKYWGSGFIVETENDHLETISSKSDIMDYHLDHKIEQINSVSNFSSRINSPNQILRKGSPNQPSSTILIVKNNQVQMPFPSRRFQGLPELTGSPEFNELQIDTLRLQSLNTYGKLWTNDRLLKRNIIMTRKLILLQNLDSRKNKILISNQKLIFDHVTYVAHKKYKKQEQNCNQKGKTKDDENELQRILQKKHKFIEKQVYLECRKVVALKLKKAIFFNQFRKQNCEKRSLQIIAEYQQKSQLLGQIVQDREQNSIEQLFRVVDFQTISLIELYKIVDELLLRSKPDITCNISSEAPNYSTYIQQNKSQVYKTIGEKFFDTFIFHRLDKFQQLYSMQLFLDELFPIQPFQLIKHIQDEFWIIESKDSSKQLMQFMQLKYCDYLIHQPLIKSELGVSSIPNKYCIKESNLVDQIDDFLIKGYAIVFYENKTFISLRNVLKKREKCNLWYSEQELLKFFKANLFLIENGFTGDFQTNQFFLNISEQYEIHNPKRCKDQINSLIIVLLQMATLKDNIVNLEQELSQINYPHLREAIEDLQNQNLTVEKINNYIDEENDNFKEVYSYLLASDISNDKNIVTLLNYEINIHFRLKQYELATESINRLQPILLKQVQKDADINTIVSERMHFIMQNENVMDDLANYFLCEYIRLAIQLQIQGENFLEQSRSVITILTELLNQINEIQQICQEDDGNSQICNSFLEFNPQQEMQSGHLITYPYSLQIFIRQLTRFKNQIMALQAIHYFYEGKFLPSCQILKLVVQNQSQLIERDKFHKAILDTEQEEDIRVFNFDQMSPQIKSLSQEDQIINQYIQYKPSYCHQAIVYQYLLLIVISDQGEIAEHYDSRFKNFLKIQCKEIFKDKLVFNLKLNENIDDTFDHLQNCLIGRQSWIWRNKWQENNGIYRDFEYDSNDYEYMARQVLNYGLINPSLKNRKFLTDILKVSKQDIVKIKAIQLILHMDNYLSLNQLNKIQKLEIKIDQKILKSSLIEQLKAIHSQFYIAQNSWFYSTGLKHFRYFYYLSICFSFSKKHIENLFDNSIITSLAQETLLKLDFQGEFQFYYFKGIQILLKPNESTFIESASNDIKYSIINSLLYTQIWQGQSLEQFITQSVNIFPNFLIYPSVLLLSLIICLIQYSYKELPLLMIKICQKLIANKSYLLNIKHEGFENDLLYLEFILTNQNYYIQNNNFMIKEQQFGIEGNFQLQLQLLLFQMFNSTSNFKNIEIIQNVLAILPEEHHQIQYLKLLCELISWIQSNLIDPMDLEFPEKYFFFYFRRLLKQTYDSSLYEIIIKHSITRFYLITKRYSQIENVSQRVIDLFYQMTLRQTQVQQNQLQKNETTILFDFFQSNSQISIYFNEFDLQYYFLLNQYFRNEVLLNYLEIQLFLDLNKVKLLYFYLLFINLQDDMLISLYFKLLSQLLYEYSLNNYILEQQLNNSLLSSSVAKLKEIGHSLRIKQKQLSLNHANYDVQVKTNRQLKLVTFLISIYNSFKSKVDSEKLIDFSLQCAKLQKRFLVNYQLTLGENYDTKTDIILQIHNADNQLLLCQCYLQMNDLENAWQSINEAEVLYSMMTRQDPSFSYFQLELTKYRIFYFRFMVTALYNLWKEVHQFKYCILKLLVQKILYYNAEITVLFQAYNKGDQKLLAIKILSYLESDPNSYVNEIEYSDFKTYYIQAIDAIMLEIYTTFSRSMYMAEQHGIIHNQKSRLSVLMQDLKSFLQSLTFLN